MPDLRPALNNLYSALLEDSEDNVKRKYIDARDALFDMYKDVDGRITNEIDACKFGTLQRCLMTVIAAPDIDKRRDNICSAITSINSFKRHFVGRQAKVLDFLRKVERNINRTKFFAGIILEGLEENTQGNWDRTNFYYNNRLLALENEAWRQLAREIRQREARGASAILDGDHDLDDEVYSDGTTPLTDMDKTEIMNYVNEVGVTDAERDEYRNWRSNQNRRS